MYFVISACLFIIMFSVFSLVKLLRKKCFASSWLANIPYSLSIALLILFLLSRFDKALHSYFLPCALIISVTCLITFCLLLVYGNISHNRRFKKLFGLVGLYGLTILPEVPRNEFPLSVIVWLVCCIMAYTSIYCCRKK